jgi:O-antigen/teichoic acid export membrane protein
MSLEIPTLSPDRPDGDEIKQKTLDGVTKMAGREMLIKLLALGGGIVLARALEPAAFGLFAVATFVVGLFTMFTELGFGAALIRKPGKLRPEELNTFFTFQLVLVSVLCAALILLAPLAGLVYKGEGITWIIRALSVSLFLTSLRSVPLVISERNLAYGPVALSDVSGQVAYWSVAVGMALAGFGVWSLVTALIASGLVGTVLLFWRTGWRPRLEFDLSLLRANMRFGLLYQGQSVAHFAKDMMMPSLGGAVYGGSAVGYLAWARQLALFPLQLTTLVSRVSYPALSKLQSDPKAFGELVEITLRWTCRLILPAFAVLVGLAPQIIQYVYGPKWLPALPSLYLLYFTVILGVGTGGLLPALYSVGKAGAALRISAGWALLTWMIALGLVWMGMGFEALAAANLLSSAFALTWIVIEVRRLGKIDLLGAVWLPVVSGICTGGLCFLIAPIMVHSLWALIAMAFVTGVSALGINLWEDRSAVILSARSLVRGTLRSHPVANRLKSEG